MALICGRVTIVCDSVEEFTTLLDSGAALPGATVVGLFPDDLRFEVDLDSVSG